MCETYPQESMGNTLLVVDRWSEYRRVFVHMVGTELEVGEFTRGELTADVYGAPAHYHCVRLDDEGARGVTVDRDCQDVESLLAHYFADDERFLADLMDDLDARGVPYGYLDCVVGEYVSYRPRQMSPVLRGERTLVLV